MHAVCNDFSAPPYPAFHSPVRNPLLSPPVFCWPGEQGIYRPLHLPECTVLAQSSPAKMATRPIRFW